MKKIVVAIWLMVVFILSTMAQNEVDALRYSQMNILGTARASSMGGAFGALGADFTALSINPAGIGFYKSSEVTFTPTIYTGKTSSDYFNSTNEEMKYNFNVSNIGIVFSSSPKDKDNDWKGFQFGFGMNKLANFNNSILIEGANPDNSILNDYLLKATGIEPSGLDPFDTELAYNTWLLDTIGTLTDYEVAFKDGGALQTKYIETSGSINEMVFTIGGNYDNKLYIGGTFAFPYLKYYENSTYREIDETDSISNFDELNIHEEIETQGSGFNFKFGLIYRITDWMRIGASVHTPTFFSLRDEYSKQISAYYDNGDNYSDDSPNGSFDYELNTPLKAVGSIAFVVSKFALISADYEFIDYSDARLRSKTYKFFDENDAIESKYMQASKIRGGFEIRLMPISLRGGCQLIMSPYKNGINDGESISYSGGIGVRDKSYFLDIGYVYTAKSEDYYLYPSVPQAAENNFSSHNILLTLGLRF